MAIDKLRSNLLNSDSARRVDVITPDNATDLTNTYMALWVGSAGDVKVDMPDGGTGVTFKNVPAGSILPIMPKRIYATGTTAANMLGLY